MLTIRLQRAGKKNRPEFRIILAEKTAAANKKFVEILGNYNPRTKSFGIKEDRLQYWIAQHVEISPTAHNLFVTKNLLNLPKVRAFNTPAQPTPAPEAPAAAAEAPNEAVMETPAEEAAAEVSAEPVVETPAPETPAEAPTETPAE